MTMRLRFPDIPPAGALYESVYTVLSHPTEAQAIWIRTTVRKRPHQQPTGAVWMTWFHEGTVRAGKVDGLVVEAATGAITVGGTRQGVAGSHGGLASPTLEARWEVDFTPLAEPLEHLAPSFLYRTPVPRTKATSPVPALEAHGVVTIDGSAIDVTGWTGMLGHNWGSEHAARWVWLRAAGLGDDRSGWLDSILGRVRIGRVLTPWTSFGMLCLDGERYRLGGLVRRGSAVDVRGSGADLTLAGKDVRLLVHATVEPGSIVGWEYADPVGHRHEVVNSSVASMTIEVERGSRHDVLRPVPRGVLELGGDERAFDVQLQPYPD